MKSPPPTLMDETKAFVAAQKSAGASSLHIIAAVTGWLASKEGIDDEEIEEIAKGCFISGWGMPLPAARLDTVSKQTRTLASFIPSPLQQRKRGS